MGDKPVAIVTGGGTGIGAACCLALGRAGFRVGIHYRGSEEGAKAVLADIDDGFLLQADLTDIDQVEAMVARLKGAPEEIEILVNNAGVSVNNDISGMKIEEFDAQRA